jgi:hypothetical protein
MQNIKQTNHTDSLFLLNSLTDINSVNSQNILNLGNKIFVKWTDCSDFISSYQKDLKVNEKASVEYFSAFEKFSQKKQIPIWIKSKDMVAQFSYYELLEKHLTCSKDLTFDLNNCEYSYFSEDGPFFKNSLFQIIGLKNIESLVSFLLLDNKISLRNFRVKAHGVCSFSFDDVFMLHGLQVHSIDKLGMNASLPQNYLSNFSQFEKFHFYLDTSIFETTNNLNLEQAARHFKFYDRDIFATRDPLFLNTFKTSDIIIRPHSLDSSKILIYIPFDKNLNNSNLKNVMNKFIEHTKQQLFEHYKI